MTDKLSYSAEQQLEASDVARRFLLHLFFASKGALRTTKGELFAPRYVVLTEILR